MCLSVSFKYLNPDFGYFISAVVLCCFEDGCNASVERVKDSLRRVNSAPSDPDNQSKT